MRHTTTTGNNTTQHTNIVQQKTTGDTTNITLTGTLSWAKVYPENAGLKFGERNTKEYSVQVSISPTDVATIENKYNVSLNLRKNKAKQVITDANGYHQLHLKANFSFKDGALTTPPVVLGTDGKPTKELIGNDSIGLVQFVITPYEFAGKHGVRTQLTAIRLTKLVPYKQLVDMAALGVDESEEQDNTDINDLVKSSFE